MTALFDLLASRGARAGPSGIADFGSPDREWAAARSDAVVADASSIGVVTIAGADAAAFLHGQLSNDVHALDPGQGHWTSYNSPKGRLLATMFLARRPSTAVDGYLAWLAADLAAGVSKRLSMFVLRSKAALVDATPALVRLGIGGPAAGRAVHSAFGVAPAAGRLAMRGDVGIVQWPDGRIVVSAPHAEALDCFDTLARYATPAGAPVWEWLAVRSGVPVITGATQDRFVAQAANWDAIGGLDFRKGCYPGQEIVARMQYLGRLNERLHAFRADADPPAPATRLFGAPFGDQPSGTVVNSARDPAGGTRFLAVVQSVAADAGPLAIGDPAGPRATREPLPYPVPAPAAPRGRLGG